MCRPVTVRPATARLLAIALLVALGAPACALPPQVRQAFGIRQQVDDATARDVLAQAVGLAASGQADRLCALSPADASTCAESLATAGDLVPTAGPRITCSVAAPEDGPLRGGRVLVLQGEDVNDDPYTTEFIVYDDGTAVGALDAVWWSGLTVRSYAEDTVTWGFDSASRTCERGGLPAPNPFVEPPPTE